VGTQTVWIVFIAWLALSKYGAIRLGKDTDRPEHSNLAYFSMLFSAGIAVGVYYWGVSEPMYYYRGGKLYKPGFLNDDQRAQQARPPPLPSYLTQCINSMVSESQLPHKTVNLLF
jgi:choline-glycine betaine transporter